MVPRAEVHFEVRKLLRDNFGGTYPCDGGIVFSVRTSGQEKVLHRLNCGTDGAFPRELFDLNGVLYGTSFGGVTNNRYGTVFRLLP